MLGLDEDVLADWTAFGALGLERRAKGFEVATREKSVPALAGMERFTHEDRIGCFQLEVHRLSKLATTSTFPISRISRIRSASVSTFFPFPFSFAAPPTGPKLSYLSKSSLTPFTSPPRARLASPKRLPWRVPSPGMSLRRVEERAAEAAAVTLDFEVEVWEGWAWPRRRKGSRWSLRWSNSRISGAASSLFWSWTPRRVSVREITRKGELTS